MRTRVALVVLLLAVSTACTAADFDLYLEEIANDDLSASEDPAVRAAGDSAQEVEKIEEAEAEVMVAFGEDDLHYADRRDALVRAQRLRPDDPRYDMWEAVFHAYFDTDGRPLARDYGFTEAMNRAGSKLGSLSSDPNRAGLMGVELFADTLLDLIRRFEHAPGHSYAVKTYCTYIGGMYQERYGTEFPLETALYLAVRADFSVCP